MRPSLAILLSFVLAAGCSSGRSGGASLAGAAVAPTTSSASAPSVPVARKITFAERPAVWSELVGFAQLRAALPLLEKRGLHLHVAVHEKDLGPELEALVR